MANCVTGGSGLIKACSLPQTGANQDTLNHLLTIIFTVMGGIALLMLVIAGLRYVVSGDEPQKAAEVRRQIIFIAAGLILIIMADVIVTFVLNKVGK